MGVSKQQSVHIRPAKLDEAVALTALALRAKAHWGYSPEFMQAARADLTITSTQLAALSAFVLEQNGNVAGFYTLREVTATSVELADLFVDPPAIGYGWGRLLWEHAVATARSRGYLQMTFDSDPNAEGFYYHMGAQRIGEAESSVKPGRLLPRMLYPLQPSEPSKGDEIGNTNIRRGTG